MRSGIGFSEDHLNPNAEVRILEQVIGWRPTERTDIPSSIYGYLSTLTAKSSHGGAFEYRSCETDVLGWVCERSAGVAMPELLSQLIWQPMGAKKDADIAVNGVGTALHDGGIAASLRDLARFGLMLLNDGRVGKRQLIPSWWIADSYSGAADSRASFGLSPTDTRMPGGMYRNQFWVPYLDRHILLCLGIHGQLVYVDPVRSVVAVKLSSWPYPQDARMLFDTLAAIDTLANLVAGPGS